MASGASEWGKGPFCVLFSRRIFARLSVCLPDECGFTDQHTPGEKFANRRSAYQSRFELMVAIRNVRFSAHCGLGADIARGPLCAKGGQSADPLIR